MDIGTLTGSIELEDLLSPALARIEQALDRLGETAAQSMERAESSMTKAATVGSFFGNVLAQVGLKALAFGKDLVTGSLMAGARLEQLGVATRFLGEKAGYTGQFIDDLAQKIQATGISGISTRESILQLLSANIDLANAAKLSAIAQNMQSLSGRSSSEVFQVMTRAIATGNTELLRGIGFQNISIEGLKRQAKETTGFTGALTGAARSSMIMNAILEEGAQKAGLYAESMTTAGKQASSAERAWAEVSEQIGTVLLPITSVAIKAWYSLGGAVRDSVMGSKEVVKDAMESIAASLQTVITKTMEVVSTTVSAGVSIYKTYQSIPEVFRNVGRDVLLATGALWLLNKALTSVIAQQIWLFVTGFTTRIGLLGLALQNLWLVMLAHPLVALAAGIGVVTLAITGWIEATANAELASATAAAKQDTINAAIAKGAVQTITYAEAIEYMTKLQIAANDPMTRINERLKEMVANGASAAERAEFFAGRIREMASAGTLSGDVMKDFAQKIKDLKIPIEQLDPVLRNLVMGLDQAAVAAEGLRYLEDVVNSLRTGALEPLADGVKAAVRELNSLGQTEDQIVTSVLASAEGIGVSEAAVKRYAKSVKEGTTASEALSKKVTELAQSFRGVDSETAVIVAAFGKLKEAELQTLEVQERVAPSIVKIIEAGGTLSASMDQLLVSYQNNLEAERERLTEMAKEGIVSAAVVESLKQLGLSEELIARQYGLTAVQLGKLLALKDRELATEQRLASFQHAAVAQREKDAARVEELTKESYATLAASRKSYDDLVMQSTMTTLDYQTAKIKEQAAEEIAAYGAKYGIETEQYRAFVQTMGRISDQQVADLKIDNEAIQNNTKRALQDVADRAMNTYLEMAAHPERYKNSTIAAFRTIAQEAQDSADGVKDSYGEALDLLASGFVRLGQIAGGALGSIIAGIGHVVAQLKTAHDMTEQISKSGLKIGGNFGALSVIFSKNAKDAQKMAAAIQAAAAVAQGISDINEATKAPTLGGRVGGGALAGAKAGAAFGPYGAIIGAGVGALVGAIRGAPEWAKVASGVGRDFGVKISEETAKAIEASEDEVGKALVKSLMAAENIGVRQAMEMAKAIGGTFRQEAATLNLDKIIEEAGGLDTKNIDMFMGKLRDTFVFLGRGTLDAAQATEVLDENFAAFADHYVKNGGIITAELQEIIDLHDEASLHSAAVTEFVIGQTKSAIDGLTTFLTSKSKAVNVTTQQSASAFGAAITASFLELIHRGVSVKDALDAIQPAVKGLAERLHETGLTGGAAFERLQGLIALASDEIAGPAIDAINGLGQALVGLHNAGLLDQQMFTGLSGQITETYNSLIAQGYDGNQALLLMQPTVQTLWELQQDHKFAVDDATQAIIDQGLEQGTVGEHMRDINDRILGVLEAIAEVLGAVLPGEAAKAERAMRGVGSAVDAIPSHKTITFQIDENVTRHIEEIANRNPDLEAYWQQYPERRPGYVPGAAQGALVGQQGLIYAASGGVIKQASNRLAYADTGGMVPKPFKEPLWRPRGTDTVPAMLTPGERVLSVKQNKEYEAGERGKREVNITIAPVLNFPVEADHLTKEYMRQVVALEVVEAVRLNINDVATRLYSL